MSGKDLAVILLCISGLLEPGETARGETQQRMIELPLPRAPLAGEDIWLQLRIRPLPRGAEILVSTSDGILVGTASSFGAPRNRDLVTYMIPLPKAAIVAGKVRLRLDVDQSGSSERVQSQIQIESTSLIYLPSGKSPQE